MSRRTGRVWHLIQGLGVAGLLLVAAMPVESALQLVQPSLEAEKAVSCTVTSPSDERVTDDRPAPAPRVATGEQPPDNERSRRPAPAHPQVCPLLPEQDPGPPRGRP